MSREKRPSINDGGKARGFSIFIPDAQLYGRCDAIQLVKEGREKLLPLPYRHRHTHTHTLLPNPTKSSLLSRTRQGGRVAACKAELQESWRPSWPQAHTRVPFSPRDFPEPRTGVRLLRLPRPFAAQAT
jgi:hypothetical protein